MYSRPRYYPTKFSTKFSTQEPCHVLHQAGEGLQQEPELENAEGIFEGLDEFMYCTYG